MPADQFAFVAESGRAKDGCGSCTVDSDPAQLWTAERVVPTAGRFGGVADIAASPCAVSGTSRTAHPVAVTLGTGPSDGSNGRCDCQGGLQNTQVQSGI